MLSGCQRPCPDGCSLFPYSDGLGTLPDREELAALGLREVAMEGTEQEAGGEASALLAGATAEGEAARPIAGTKEKEPAAVKGSGKEKGETPPAEPFLLSEGLPPVPAKLVAKIQRGEYVDMTELLRDNMEATRRRLDTDAPHCSSDTKKNRREIPDFLSWLQCFGVYASIVVSKQPDRFRQLMAYQTLMIREARRCGGTGWLAYDAMFRQQAAHAPGTDWSKLNTSLYTVTFMAQHNGRGRTCQHCLETDHDGADCALAPSQPLGRGPQQVGLGWVPPVAAAYEQRRSSAGPSAPGSRGYESRRSSGGSVLYEARRSNSGTGRPGQSGRRNDGASSLARRACFQWNEGGCDYYGCKFRHVCIRCGGDHRLSGCNVSNVPGRRMEDKSM